MKDSLNPAVTVAAIVERRGRFLFVEEQTSTGLAINQPAGHLEAHESLPQAVTREALEETAWHIQPEALVGVYLWRRPQREVTIVRFAFAARGVRHADGLELDEGIVRTLWLSRAELDQRRHRMRSPLVARCVDDYLAGRRFPLDVVAGIAPSPGDHNVRGGGAS